MNSKYENRAPSMQTMADVFEGKWESQLPGVASGAAKKFADKRVEWALEQIGGVDNKTVLELGPFEGFHSYRFHENGAKAVLAIESNRENFLKSLVVKEMFQLHSVKFTVGDAQSYLRQRAFERFDVGWASGILYHLQEPVQFLDNLLSSSDAVYVWTHYFSDDISTLTNGQEAHFVQTHNRFSEWNGKQIQLHARSYLIPEYSEREVGVWQGGIEDLTFWMKKSDILHIVENSGFSNVVCGPDSAVNGLPCFDFIAVR